ncbi:hypothetical protein F511_36364 [Dorcoceras hygrometricum]|uniref:Uncharacterized protein n=1 Tax=Dorcoceras hygrometricum TaxID=472368 RepID=A0A2Z7CGH1_9LAMI|nr:hypothetical protein F511_36364 [Dorcoceras hygrometricum]
MLEHLARPAICENNTNKICHARWDRDMPPKNKEQTDKNKEVDSMPELEELPTTDEEHQEMSVQNMVNSIEGHSHGHAIAKQPAESQEDIPEKNTVEMEEASKMMQNLCKPAKELRFWSWTGLGVDPVVQPLKCQFPRGIGRSQVPGRHQGLTNLARTEASRHGDRNKSDHVNGGTRRRHGAAQGGGRLGRVGEEGGG